MPVEAIVTQGYEGLKHITATRRRVKEAVFAAELPKVNPTHFTAHERAHMFAIAASAWNTTFSHTSLNELLASDSRRTAEEQFRALKDLRKFGMILKTGYLFFDDRQTAPAPLHLLIRSLGQLNDHFFTPDRDTHMAHVTAVLENVYTPDTTLNFQPATDDTYRSKVNTAISSISQGIQQPEVGVETFHDMRKTLRHLMNIFQLAAALTGHQQYEHLFTHLDTLSSDLGKTHDSLVQQAYEGKIVYDTSQVVIDSVTQERVSRTLQALLPIPLS